MDNRFYGKLWQNRDYFNIIKANSGKILDIQLALESYGDNRNVIIEELVEPFKALHRLRFDNVDLTEKEMVELSNSILADLLKVIDHLGREHFVFYSSGNIEYKWDSSV